MAGSWSTGLRKSGMAVEELVWVLERLQRTAWSTLPMAGGVQMSEQGNRGGGGAGLGRWETETSTKMD